MVRQTFYHWSELHFNDCVKINHYLSVDVHVDYIWYVKL